MNNQKEVNVNLNLNSTNATKNDKSNNQNGRGTIEKDGILPKGEEGKEIINLLKENEVLLMFKSGV